MKYMFFILLFAGVLAYGSSELYITSLPKGIDLAGKTPSIKTSDVSSVISYLLGLPAEAPVSWNDASRIDFFSRPKANLFLNILVPDKLKFDLKQFKARYNLDDFSAEPPSLETTNAALYELYSNGKPLIVYYEADDQLLNVARFNADMLNDLPVTLELIKDRLRNESSIADELKADSCLTISNNAVAYFLGELQLLSDILAKLSANRNQIGDGVMDSYYFSLTTLARLVRDYGSQSCQVQEALKILQSFIPKFVESFNHLYDDQLLSEVYVARSPGRMFGEASVRHTRSTQQDTPHVIHKMTKPLPPEYPVTVNLTFWVMVVFALATLAASYGIWFMNPGWDSIIYRMTTQRLKVE